MPQVAIITRTKNRQLLLQRAIESVLQQTYFDWLHVIVNDGGDKNEIEVLAKRHGTEYAGRIKIIHNDVSSGMEAAANVGIRASESTYIVILDDDDTWSPTFLQRSIDALSRETWPETRGIFCHTSIVDEKIDGDIIKEIGRRDFNQWLNAIDLLSLFAWNRFTPVCFLYQRSALEQVGLYDETLPVCGDWEFNIRFLCSYEIIVLRETLAFWHQRPAQTKGDYGNSVGIDWHLHEIYRARLINRWIRTSFRDGSLSFGGAFGLCLAGEQQHALGRIERRLEALERPRKGILRYAKERLRL